MNIVLFTSQDTNFCIPAKDDRAKHITKILHKQVGDTFYAGIENGKSGTAEILAIDDNGISCTFTPQTEGKPLYPLEMIIGFPRPIQLKRLFRDMASLGIGTIHLCGTENGEKSYLDSKIIERGSAHNLLRDGTIQAKSTHVPDLKTYVSVKDCLEKLHLISPKNTDILNQKTPPICITLDNVENATSLSSFLHTVKKTDKPMHSRVIAAIGSERGWTNTERQLFETAKFTRCSMGERILRTETAATVAATVILENIFNII